jgi:hypothetical protein
MGGMFMMHELMKEKIMLDVKAGRETMQVLLEGDVIVPDIKPDMALILQTDAKVNINSAETTLDRINFLGKLDIQVLYLARESEKPVHSMNMVTNIDDFINMEGVTRDMWVNVKADISNIEYKMINDRKISYRAIVEVSIDAWNPNSYEVIVDIDGVPESQQLKSTLNMSRNIENRSDKFLVKEALQIPAGKPNIREILQSNVNISNKDVRVSNGRVTVQGELMVTILYKGDSENSLIELTEHEIPFTESIDIPSVKDNMLADINLLIDQEYIQLTQDQDGEDRAINIEISIEGTIKVQTQDTIEVLEDAYCTNVKLCIAKELIKYPKLICRNKNQASIKEIVSLTSTSPDLFQIFRAKGKAIIDDITVSQDKIIAEGIIDADILYVAENDDTPLFSFNTLIPFRQVIETKGSREGMEVLVDVSVDHIGFNMISSREIELKLSLSFNTQVLEELETNLITSIEFEELESDFLDNIASMTLYVVNKGDTMWSIAKRYNTSIDEIVAINEVENPYNLQIGQKLLILKNVVKD